MPRLSPLYALALAALPYALISIQQEQRKASPAESQQAAKVMTMLRARCASCHTGERAVARLDLSSPEGLRKAAAAGRVFEVGHGKDSVLVQRLRGDGGKPQMPLGFAPMSDEEIQMVAAWIDAGALTEVSAPHWAYQKPVRPKLPEVRGKSWPRNEIDRFILARLEKEGLKPSPEASKETLIRRASLDLIGLPPTVEEVDAFLADKRPDAYERLVDKLLASPHYGERQARMWLDLARYADTDGYEKDLRRTAWKWRDWVIAAYNKNLPFDEFTLQQIAGDQLPQPTVDQLVATGFHRNTMLNLEGGVDQEEAFFNIVVDRVSTTSTVWLGSSMACARCHDHKYDPFSQKDFYKMAAFFSNAEIKSVGPKSIGEEKWYEPSMEVPTPDQVAKRTKLRQELNNAERRAKTFTPALRESYAAWLRTASEAKPWTGFSATSMVIESGSKPKVGSDGSVLLTGERPAKDTYTLDTTTREAATGLRLEALTDDALSSKGPGRSDNGNFVINKVAVNANGKPVKLRTAVADFTQDKFTPQNVISGDRGTGWAVVPQTGKDHELVLEFDEAVQAGSQIQVVIEQQTNYQFHTLGKFRLSLSSFENPARTVLPPNIRALLAKQDRDAKEIALLEQHYLATEPSLAATRSRVAALRMELDRVTASIPTALIMRDKPNPGPLQAHFRERGEFLSKGELVAASTPTILPAIQSKPRLNRVDLAKWLVSEDNPLTARVQTNRMWEQYFGRGIVETTEDLGTQSAPPSHPELLDWLANEFMRRDWDMKAVHRLIVTSSAYRQSSNATKALLAKDPTNMLLARGPRFRLEAEMIRDTSLRAAGLLNPKIGGPSVFPYQPEGVWDSAFISERWMESKDGDNLRRGIYTFWKRTMPYASFTAFDTSSREECTVRRPRTNTPLQALALLNDQSTFVAAKALGETMSKKGLVYGFRSCTSRKPTVAEVQRLERLRTSLTAKYKKSPAESKKIAATPALAAWTMVANVLLNLDETINKG